MNIFKGKKLAWSILAICLVILIITGMTISSLYTAKGNYMVKEVLIQKDGYSLSGSLYVPKAALTMDEEGNFISKAPALIAQGGGSATRSMEEDFTIELVKRGFVVFLFDAYNHGLSDKYDYGSHYGNFLHVDHAVEYMQSLNFVDTRYIGYSGHSQGGRATQYALSRYAGFYTLPDVLFNMLHDELNVDVTAEQVASQDPDAVAQKLSDYGQGYYEVRKKEITHDYIYNRVTFGISQGQVMRDWMLPQVVEVAGNPVYRDMQANFAVANALEDESSSSRKLDYPTNEGLRSVMGTGEDTIERDTLYAVNLSSTDQPVQSTILGAFDGSSRDNQAVRDAAANNSLRLLVQFPGEHNGNLRQQNNIDCVVEFSSLATGFNNGFIAETNGNGAAPMGGTSWKAYAAANDISFLVLLVLAGAIALLMLRSKLAEPILGEALEPQMTKKNIMAWISLAVLAIVPILFLGPVANFQDDNMLIKLTAASGLGRINCILLWALANTVFLLAFVIIKWFVSDKKKVDVGFFEFYGLRCTVKSVLISLVYAAVVYGIFYTVINLYHDVFNGAGFNIDFFNLISYKIISPERYLSMILYSLYFLPFWIVSGMMVNSFRMKDLPDWATTLIQVVANTLPIALYVIIQFVGYISTKHSTGVATEVLGLHWGLAYQICGMIFALPAAVVYSRKIYKKTGSILPGAFVNTLIFTLLQINNVMGT